MSESSLMHHKAPNLLLLISRIMSSMTKASEEAKISLPHDNNFVFDNAIEILKALNFKIKNFNKENGTINATTKISMYSWGENINISIEPINKKHTRLYIKSSLKIGRGFLANPKNKNNIDAFLNSFKQDSITSSDTEYFKTNQEPTEIIDKTQRNKNLTIYWLIFIALFLFNKIIPAIFIYAIVATISLGYVLYYIISEGYSDIFKGVMTSLILVLITVIFPPFLVILLIWAVFHITNTIKSIKTLLPTFFLNLSLWIALSVDNITNFLDKELDKDVAIFTQITANIIYFFLVFALIKKISDLPIKKGLIRLSIVFASAQVIMIMIYSVAQSIVNFFSITSGSITKNIKITQNVSAHMRGDIAVNSYTRDVSKAVTETVITHTAGVGSIIAGASGEASKQLDSKNHQ